MTWRLGTRGSALATTQSNWVAEQLRTSSGRAVELVIIKTHGDVTSGPLASMSQSGVFVSALRNALLAGEVDFLVHSMKDLPSEPHPGIALAAVPERQVVNDALLTHNRLPLSALPEGARVGSSSPRRAARLLQARPDLRFSDLRGNVDSRIAKVREGELDATILAAAGLHRLGRADEIDELLSLEVMLPAPAQGALAVECREDDVELRAALAALDVPLARVATTAERAVLTAVSATCASAVGAHARFEGDELELVAEVGGREVGQWLQRSASVRLPAAGDARVASAYDLGWQVGRALLEAGAAAFMNSSADHA